MTGASAPLLRDSENPTPVAPKFLTYGNWKNECLVFFKPLHFRIICYTALDNWHISCDLNTSFPQRKCTSPLMSHKTPHTLFIIYYFSSFVFCHPPLPPQFQLSWPLHLSSHVLQGPCAPAIPSLLPCLSQTFTRMTSSPREDLLITLPEMQLPYLQCPPHTFSIFPPSFIFSLAHTIFYIPHILLSSLFY